MKKLIILLLAILLIASCTKETSTDQQNELYGTALKGGVADITIEPSGDLSGATDADAIVSALTALPAGGVLLLESGTFFINRTIVAPASFSGTISGKGMNKTEIIGVGDISTPFMVTPPVTPVSFNYYPNETLFLFYNPDGFVDVNNLSMSIPVDLETDGDYRHSLFAFISTILRDNEADTSFSKLKLTGKDMDYPDDEASPAVAILVAGGDGGDNDARMPIFGGTHSVVNCEISKIAVPPSAHARFIGAKIVLKGNTCFDVRQTQLLRLIGCDITVKDNNMSGFDISALNLNQNGIPIPGESNRVEIKNNTISTTSWMAIEIGPVPGVEDADFKVIIKNNVLKNSGDVSNFGFPPLAVVGIFQGNENAIVKDNIILGNTLYGIFQESNEGSFKENDLTDLNASLFDYILLGNDNELKGIGASTVDDQGIGNTIKN